MPCFGYTSKISLLILLFIFSLLAIQGFAWSPENGIGICTVSGQQTEPQMVSDGFGGAVITWVDGRNNGGTTDIYAQRINTYGAKLWAQNGIPICTASSNQQFSNPNITDAIIADGNGNYIITWQDYRNGNWDIYAQKITSQGSTFWAINGIAVCTVSTNQVSPSLVSDGAGGAIIAWQDLRNDYGNSSTWRDIYVQRIDNNGIPLWTLGGVSICTAKYTQDAQVLISDENHGAIIAWRDYRVPFLIPQTYPPGIYLYDHNSNAYAQRIDSNGNTLWTNNGIKKTYNYADWGGQNAPQMLPDGNGGAFIACGHNLSNFGPPEVAYIFRIDSSSSTLWSCSVMTTIGGESNPMFTTDGNNGVLVVLNGYFTDNWEMRVQRLNSSGTILWPINGITISTAVFDGFNYQIVSDNVGGAILNILFYPGIGEYENQYVQRINSIGSTLWTVNGISICTVSGWYRDYTKMISDMANGAIIVWVASWNGIDSDIYAQRVYAGGYVISPVNVPKELWDFEP
jgi:hypothetical protein